METLVEELRKAAKELERGVHSRDEFLSIASHELKTPLTPLRLQIEGLHRLLDRGTQELSRERLEPRLATIERQIERMTELVDKLLDISRITSGRMELSLEEVDLAAIVRDVAARYKDLIARSGGILTVEAPHSIVTEDQMTLAF